MPLEPNTLSIQPPWPIKFCNIWRQTKTHMCAASCTWKSPSFTSPPQQLLWNKMYFKMYSIADHVYNTYCCPTLFCELVYFQWWWNCVRLRSNHIPTDDLHLIWSYRLKYEYIIMFWHNMPKRYFGSNNCLIINHADNSEIINTLSDKWCLSNQ